MGPCLWAFSRCHVALVNQGSKRLIRIIWYVEPTRLEMARRASLSVAKLVYALKGNPSYLILRQRISIRFNSGQYGGRKWTPTPFANHRSKHGVTASLWWIGALSRNHQGEVMRAHGGEVIERGDNLRAPNPTRVRVKIRFI